MDIIGNWHPKNDETRAWMKAAAADFSSCVFLVAETATNVGEEDPTSRPAVKSIQLDTAGVDFEGFIFPGDAWFDSTTFTGITSFERATFTGNAWLGSTTFTGIASFERATFGGIASFLHATFRSDVRFGNATFRGIASFASAIFKGDARLESANFVNIARFDNSTLEGEARFDGAFFRRDTFFVRAAITGIASFESAIFSGMTSFVGATFKSDALFDSVAFERNIFFYGARFFRKAGFSLVNFERVAGFEGVQFYGDANFSAIRGARAFSLANAKFQNVPDFIQAHFEEAPRLDNMRVVVRVIDRHPRPAREKGEVGWKARWYTIRYAAGRLRTFPYRAIRGFSQRIRHAGLDMPSRWRALKRLAIEGHDTDRELAFFSGEVRSARFAIDWPWPRPLWNAEGWSGFFRFWAGLFYQILSDFGRSLLRPLLAWGLSIALFAAYYLAQSPAITDKPEGLDRRGFIGQVVTYSRLALTVISLEKPPGCFALIVPVGKPIQDSQNDFTGLVEYVRNSTNILNEAFSVSYRNAAILLDSGSDSAHRAFGCLYGIERYGGNPVPYVPRSVGIASAIQKLLSAIFLFLFGLAVRNMLKMK